MAIKKKIVKKAIIPAAGFGTRFLPATKASPKEMVPIVDKPVIQYIVEEIVTAGITDILIITGRGKRAIEDHFDQSFELYQTLKNRGKENLLHELEQIEKLAAIHYLRQKEILGLGHAILQAQSFVGDEPFAVLLGDDLVKSDKSCIGHLIEKYEKYQTSVLGIQAMPKEKIGSYGVIDGLKQKDIYRVNDMVEKPDPSSAPSNLAIFGRYVLEPEIFDILNSLKPGKNQEIQLTDAMRIHSKLKPYIATETPGQWYTCGDPLSYLITTIDYALDRPELKNELVNYIKSLKL